jgi:hypothetical protein
MQTKYRDSFAVHALHPRAEPRGFPLKTGNSISNSMRDQTPRLAVLQHGKAGATAYRFEIEME